MKEKILYKDTAGNTLREARNSKTGRLQWYGRSANGNVVNQAGLAQLIKMYKATGKSEIKAVSQRAKQMDKIKLKDTTYFDKWNTL